MGTCSRRFRRAFSSNRRFFSTKSSLVYQKLFCLVALLVFDNNFTLKVTQMITQQGHQKASFGKYLFGGGY